MAKRERAYGQFQGLIVGRIVRPNPRFAREWTLEDEGAVIELAWPGPRGDRVIIAVRGQRTKEVRVIEFDRVLLEAPESS